MSHSDLEALLEVEGRELLRRLLQAHLDERSPGTVAEPVLGADGRAHTHQRTQTRRLMTIFGEVEGDAHGLWWPRHGEPPSPRCGVERAAGALFAWRAASRGGGGRKDLV